MTRVLLPEASFWPPGIVVAPVHPSVCPSVTKFVRAITHHPFKLGSPNLDQRCKTPWLRSLLLFLLLFFCLFVFYWGGGGDQPWPSRSNLRSKSKFTPFWACPHNNSSPIQARITKFGPEVQNTLVKWQLTSTFKVKFDLKSQIFWLHHHWKYITTI